MIYNHICCFQCQVTASHIVVNQLIDDYLTSNEMEKVARILKTCGRGGYEGMVEVVYVVAGGLSNPL